MYPKYIYPIAQGFVKSARDLCPKNSHREIQYRITREIQWRFQNIWILRCNCNPWFGPDTQSRYSTCRLLQDWPGRTQNGQDSAHGDGFSYNAQTLV